MSSNDPTAPLESTGRDLQSIRKDIDRQLQTLYSIAKLMDSQFKVPFLGRIGLDPIIGLIPVVGDTLTYVVGIYIIVQAGRLEVPPHKIAKMAFHSLLDALLGYVPVGGDLVDVAYKSNARNVNIILEHFEAEIGSDGSFKRVPVPQQLLSTRGKIVLWSSISVIALLLLAVMVTPILLIALYFK